VDLNHRPLRYQRSALTKLSYGPEFLSDLAISFAIFC